MCEGRVKGAWANALVNNAPFLAIESMASVFTGDSGFIALTWSALKVSIVITSTLKSLGFEEHPLKMKRKAIKKGKNFLIQVFYNQRGIIQGRGGRAPLLFHLLSFISCFYKALFPYYRT